MQTEGENINICWSPDGNSIAVGDKNDTISIIDTRTNKISDKRKHPVEVNEIAWNNANNQFFVTTGQGTIKVYDYPSFELQANLRGHTANCYCVETDPTSKYLAVGSADAMVSLWDTQTFQCVRAFEELTYVEHCVENLSIVSDKLLYYRWPVRTLSFSFDGQYIASASEDHFIDVVSIQLYQIQIRYPNHKKITSLMSKAVNQFIMLNALQP